MNRWLGRTVIFCMALIGCVLSLQYSTGHFKSERQIILLNNTRPDFHHLLQIEKQFPEGLSSGELRDYFDYFHLVTDAMPDNSEGLLMLGYLDQITGKNVLAEGLLKESYRLNPQFFFTGYDLALVCFNRGDYAQSVDLLQKALAINPGLTMGTMMNSIIYRQIFSSMSDGNEIIPYLKQAYNDAYVLLMESAARQKGAQGANADIQVHAHIM